LHLAFERFVAAGVVEIGPRVLLKIIDRRFREWVACLLPIKASFEEGFLPEQLIDKAVGGFWDLCGEISQSRARKLAAQDGGTCVAGEPFQGRLIKPGETAPRVQAYCWG
jgi:hypothetical protein